MPSDCNLSPGMDSDAWDSLLQSMKFGECIPFLGAGASAAFFPKGQEVADRWSDNYKYPLKQKDLVSVSQFLTVTRNSLFAKNLISEEIKTALPPEKLIDFSDPSSIHGLLAQLPLSIYLTTNYDDMIERALTWASASGRRNSSFTVEYCRWHAGLRQSSSTNTNVVSSDCPLVYHFHGVAGIPRSIVITEDDYEEFLVELTTNPSIVPSEIRAAIGLNQLMFIGYSLQDWNFRVLFRAAVNNVNRITRLGGITVQLSPSEVDDPGAAAAYLERKYDKLGLKIYWGKADNFSAELSARAREQGLIKLPTNAVEI